MQTDVGYGRPLFAPVVCTQIMGLHASVYCNCFEVGSTLVAPLDTWGVHVDAHGRRACVSTDLDTQIAFDRWDFTEACRHDSGVLLEHSLGNIALIAGLRHALRESGGSFSILLGTVLYSGTHSGDAVCREDVAALLTELVELGSLDFSGTDLAPAVREFAEQIHDLAIAAFAISKPIVFE